MSRAALLTTVSFIAGCYLSHRRDVDADPPRCMARCGEPVLMASYEALNIEGLLDLAIDGERLGILAQRYHYEDGNAHPEYALVTIDLASGIVRTAETADAIRTTTHLVGGGLHVDGDVWAATVLRTDTIGSRSEIGVEVGGARWASDGTLLFQSGTLERFPEALVSCNCPHPATAFGLGDSSVAAITMGADVWAVPVTWSLSPTAQPARRIASLPDVRGTTPIDGALLEDDTFVLAGGGFAPEIEPRDAFIAFGSWREGPSEAEPFPGAPFDRPTRVERSADGSLVYLYRGVSDVDDLGMSALRAAIHDRSGGLRDELRVPFRDGLIPLELASYADGVVWVDRDGSVFVLPADARAWTECRGDVEPEPAATQPHPLAGDQRRFLAIAHGSDVLVIALQDDPSITALRLTVHRIPECRIEM
jgi:hypothetical protein